MNRQKDLYDELQQKLFAIEENRKKFEIELATTKKDLVNNQLTHSSIFCLADFTLVHRRDVQFQNLIFFHIL
jgi:hypothetical protein